MTERSAYSRWKFTIRPENTMETVETSLIRMFREGPEVSLKGSPTVSPMTAALDVYKRQIEGNGHGIGGG